LTCSKCAGKIGAELAVDKSEKKCNFLQRELVYLGFVIAENELNMDREKIAAIVNWPSPKSLFEVRSFHGLDSFYHKFIRNFSEICAPMLHTIKKRQVSLFVRPRQWRGVFSY